MKQTNRRTISLNANCRLTILYLYLYFCLLYRFELNFANERYLVLVLCLPGRFPSSNHRNEPLNPTMHTKCIIRHFTYYIHISYPYLYRYIFVVVRSNTIHRQCQCRAHHSHVLQCISVQITF